MIGHIACMFGLHADMFIHLPNRSCGGKCMIFGHIEANAEKLKRWNADRWAQIVLTANHTKYTNWLQKMISRVWRISRSSYFLFIAFQISAFQLFSLSVSWTRDTSGENDDLRPGGSQAVHLIPSRGANPVRAQPERKAIQYPDGFVFKLHGLQV